MSQGKTSSEKLLKSTKMSHIDNGPVLNQQQMLEEMMEKAALIELLNENMMRSLREMNERLDRIADRQAMQADVVEEILNVLDGPRRILRSG